MKRLDTQREGLTLFHADALELCASLDASSVDLVCVDPPYYRVSSEPWDRQWDAPEGFLAWVGQLCEAWRRVLKPNGSLYVFASPEMAARVECVVRERFNVLNLITWNKPPFATKAEMFRKEDLREFFPASERIVFAEQWGADHAADDEAGWGLECHFLHKRVFAPLGNYFQQERERAEWTRNDVEVALGYVSGSDPTRGTALCCRWEEGSSLPTSATYDRYRALLGVGFLPRPYEDLRREYEALRAEYEALRVEYEALRRPFHATPDAPYTDVWDFPTVRAYPGKHPCEKPTALLAHIIRTSTREGATVLDCCMGSGATGEAALALGRRFIGGDLSDHWAQYAAARLERRFGALPVGSGRVAKKRPNGSHPSLFVDVS